MGDSAEPTVPAIRLSVVIRCRNEAIGLRAVFNALKAQRCDFPWETVVVDNESTDHTREVCREFGVRIVPLKAQDFTYGGALNCGIEQARGELILLLSAHAIPVGEHFLEGAVAPFSDPAVAAARCLMIGNPSQIAEWYRFRDIRYNSPEEQRVAEAGDRWLRDYPTAACCVLRRSVWEQVKFDGELVANEDKHWASQVLARGYAIRCCADAVWLYTRKRSRADQWRKTIREHIALYRITGQAPLTWTGFGLLTLRAFIAAPWIAVRHIYYQTAWNAQLATVPYKSKRQLKAGTPREFDRHK